MYDGVHLFLGHQLGSLFSAEVFKWPWYRRLRHRRRELGFSLAQLSNQLAKFKKQILKNPEAVFIRNMKLLQQPWVILPKGGSRIFGLIVFVFVISMLIYIV